MNHLDTFLARFAAIGVTYIAATAFDAALRVSDPVYALFGLALTGIAFGLWYFALGRRVTA